MWLVLLRSCSAPYTFRIRNFKHANSVRVSLRCVATRLGGARACSMQFGDVARQNGGMTGPELKAARRAIGMTVQAFASESGYATSTIMSYEARGVPARSLDRILAALERGRQRAKQDPGNPLTAPLNIPVPDRFDVLDSADRTQAVELWRLEVRAWAIRHADTLIDARLQQPARTKDGDS